MRFSLFQKFSLIIVLILSLLFEGAIFAQGKTDKKITVNLKVTDENGNPVPKAMVVIGEGVKYTETDANGALAFQALASDYVKISMAGYEKIILPVSDILSNNNIKLLKSKLFMTSDDIVRLPFTTLKKRSITGDIDVVSGEQLDKYPTTDIRNAFTGLVPGLEVIEKNGATGTSPEEKLGLFGAAEKVTFSIRGRSPLIMIDDMPSDLTEIQLEPQEIESVSVIKDIVGKAMFGPMAADGIVYIKTKRGDKNQRDLNIDIEDGVSIIDRFPQWVSGADYASLNNTARSNSQVSTLYSDNDIAAYALTNPYDMSHPSVNYRDMMLKNTKSFKKVNLTAQGGNEIVQYFANVGYSGDGDIYKIGPAADYNRITARGNLDVTISDKLKVTFDLYSQLSLHRSPNYGYSSNYGSDASSDGTMDILELNRVLGDINTNSPIAFPVYANNDPSLKAPWYGVTSLFPTNPIGRILGNGYYTETGRTGKVSATFNYDLSNVIEGLSSKTYIGLDAEYLLRIGKAEDYIAYNVKPSLTTGGKDTILLTLAHNGVDMPGQAKLHDYYYNRYSIYENLSYNKSFGLNSIQTGLTYFVYKLSKNGFEEPQRQQNVAWTGNYSFNDKYYLQGVLNYAGTYSFDKDKRYKLFPSIGAGWVVSEEPFMANLGFINYLKIHAEAGILGYESFLPPYYYRDVWSGGTGTVFGPYSTNQWFGSNQDASVYRASPGRIGNPALTWEQRKEFSIGLDALAINQKLSLELSYYNNVRDGQISQLVNSIPYVSGISSAVPWYNFNKTRYFGLESGVQYTDKIGELVYSLGVNATVQSSEILKYDEPDYRFPYQSRVGQRADSYWGQKYLGKFQDDAEALVIPQIYDPILHQGDLKYLDENDDKVVDDNDMSAIGHTDPLLYYAINLKLVYKNFDMTINGSGRAFYDIPMTNTYFWNGWGDNNYSSFVKDNVGGAYPNLTYIKVNNNFVNSTYWLMKGGYFKIQNFELAYNIPSSKLQIINARGIRVFIRGANLLTFSKVKNVDPESVNSGVDSYPLFKTFTGGIKLTF